MSRKTDLEQAIRESYGIIVGYEDVIRTSNRPEEKARARRVIDEQWTLVEGCLVEYRPLVGGVLSDEMAQIAAHFAALAELFKVEQALDAQEAFRGVLPDEQLERMLAPVRDRQFSLRAQLWGSGAIAQGTDAQAVGERGIGARDLHGLAVTGDHNIVVLANEARHAGSSIASAVAAPSSRRPRSSRRSSAVNSIMRCLVSSSTEPARASWSAPREFASSIPPPQPPL